MSKKRTSEEVTEFIKKNPGSQDVIAFIESKDVSERQAYVKAYVEHYYNEFDRFRNFPNGWEHYWHLVKNGYVAPIRETGAICWMLWAIQCFPSFEKRDIDGVVRFLAENNELLENEFWLIFERRHDRFFNFIFFDSKLPDKTWTSLFIRLVEQKLLDRNRLLDGLLKVFEYEYSDKENRWFVDMFDELNPTIDEILEREQKIFQLLENRNASTRTMALAIVRKLDESGKFNPEYFLDHCHLILCEKVKSRVKAGMDILEIIAQRDSGLHEKILRSLLLSLEHEDSQVQQSAAKLLMKLDGMKRASVMESVQNLLPHLSPAATKILCKNEEEKHRYIELPDPSVPKWTQDNCPLETSESIALLFKNLAEKELVVHTLATDKLIDAIILDRLPLKNTIEAIKELQKWNKIVVLRWCGIFRIISEQSLKHAGFIRDLIEHLIPIVEQKSLGIFLDLLLDLSLICEKPIQDHACRKTLEGLTGTGKAAKLAKKLLQL